jgi:hypothetical protein
MNRKTRPKVEKSRVQRKRAKRIIKKTRDAMGLVESDLLYDPPSGWAYGFPKRYRPRPGETLIDTLLRDGYPQHEIDDGGTRHVRFIGEGAGMAAQMAVIPLWRKK